MCYSMVLYEDMLQRHFLIIENLSGITAGSSMVGTPISLIIGWSKLHKGRNEEWLLVGAVV